MDKPDGLHIRTVRRQKGLNQAQLARKAGVAEKTLKRIEAGRTAAPHPATIAAIAGALGVPSHELFHKRGGEFEDRAGADVAEGAGQPSPGPSNDEERASPEAPGSELSSRVGVEAWPFVGRDAELAQVRGCLERAPAGSGSVVLLSGEPGVGKTRLLQELVEGRSAAVECRSGRCDETPGARPFWPWTLILRTFLVGPHASSGASDVLERLQPLRPLLPELQAEDGPSLEQWSDQRRFWLFDRVAEFLRGEARRVPQLILIDDLHCGDTASLLLFEFLAHRVADSAVVLVGAFRPHHPSHPREVRQIVGGLVGSPHVVRIELCGLDVQGVTRLVEREPEICGASEVVAALLEKTDGNPLYLIQVLRELRGPATAGGSMVQRIAALVPDSVQEAVEHRINLLPQAARRVLEIAAVEGRRFQPWIAGQILGVSLEGVGELLDASEAAGLIEISDDVRRYQFTHVLLRDALYARILPRRRAALHRGVAESIESRVDCEIAGELPVLAHHYLHGATDGDTHKAIHYAQAAATEAVRSLAFENAVSLYRQALQVLEASTDAAPERVARLLLAMGDAQNRSGDGESSIATFNRAARIARRIPAPELLGYAALGVGLRFGQVFDVGLYDPEQIALLGEALESLPESQRSLRAQLWARLATARFWSDDPALSVAYSERAVRIARECAGQRMDPLFDALTAQYLASRYCPGTGSGKQIAAELATIATRTRNPEHRLHSQVIQATDTLIRTADGDAVAIERERLRALAEELQFPAARWWASGFEATCSYLEGRAAVALELAASAYRLGTKAGTGMIEATWSGHQFSYAALTGRWKAFDVGLSAAVAQFPRNPAFQCARAFSQLELGNRAAARAIFEDCADQDQGILRAPLVSSMCIAILAEVCFELEDATRAARLRQILLPSQGQNVVAGVAGVFYGPVTRYLGLLSAAEGDGRRAHDLLEVARARAQSLRARFWVARIELDLLKVGLRLARTRGVASALERMRDRALQNDWCSISQDCDRVLSGLSRTL